MSYSPTSLSGNYRTVPSITRVDLDRNQMEFVSRFVRDEWEPSPEFSHSPSGDEKTPPMSPLNLNDVDSVSFLEEKTPMNISPNRLFNSPRSSYHSTKLELPTSPEFASHTLHSEIKKTDDQVPQPFSVPLLDCEDLVEFHRIMGKLQGRAQISSDVHRSLSRTDNSLTNTQSSFKAKINERIMLAALYQGLAKTIRKLGFNEYSIVVPPTVREASYHLNQGFRPVGVSAWQVGKFRYNTTSGLWTPHHPKFRGRQAPPCPPRIEA